jgi:hypothetical protein
MRRTILRLALLGSTAAAFGGALPALPQTSPAAPDRSHPPATTEGSTRPGAAAPATPRNDTATGATVAPTGTEGRTSGNSAVTTDEATRLGPLEAGANSFTEGQARSRIEDAGFTNIQGLRKDGNGIWRGQAVREGRQVEVGLDYRGNVAPTR